jgi:hypothetical protein
VPLLEVVVGVELMALFPLVPGAVTLAALLTATAPTPHPVSPPASSPAALTTIRAVLVLRNFTMLERVMCILGLWSELDL